MEAETVPPPRRLMGTYAFAAVERGDVRRIFEDLCWEGMPHHVAVFEGHHVRRFEKLARVMDWEWIEPQG